MNVIQLVELDEVKEELMVKAALCTMEGLEKELKEQHKDTITKFLNFRDPDTDWDSYEGGLWWWGPGSVMLCELGYTIEAKWTSDELVVIYK